MARHRRVRVQLPVGVESFLVGRRGEHLSGPSVSEQWHRTGNRRLHGDAFHDHQRPALSDDAL